MSATTEDLDEVCDGVAIAASTGHRALWLVRERGAALACVLFVGVVTIYRLGTLRHARYPGHADPAFYYNVAQNIHAGRGAQVDYAWHFLSGQPPLPRYAFDYWLPLPSVLMSVALRVHDSFATALSVSVWMSVLLAAATYVLARCLTRSRWVPSAGAAVVAVQPMVSEFGVQAEAPLYLATFATFALAAAIAARTRPWLWPIAGVLAALANLARNDGLLLIIALIVTAVVWSARGRRLRVVATLVGGYVLAMSPLYVENLRQMGTLMPASSMKLPFVASADDLFSLHVAHSPSAFFGSSIGDFVLLRLTTAAQVVDGVLGIMYPVDLAAVLLLLGVGLSRPDRRSSIRSTSSPWFAPASFATAVLLFYTLLVPALSFAMQKWLVAFVPALVIGALIGLDQIGLRPVSVIGVIAVLVAAPMLTLATITRNTIDRNNAGGITASALTPELAAEQACLDKPVVLMTRIPWEITQATGVRTVMIPNGPLADILEVAHRYGVTDIRMDVDYAALAQANLTSSTGPFAPSTIEADVEVLRIKDEVRGAHC